MESMLDRPEQELVLVVDDTPDNLLLMRELLEEQYRVRTAGSGPAGLRAAVEEPRPDLILLDVNMPGMDGYEVCRRLKADPLTRDIPLMFLTARADRDDEQQGLALGAVDYLGKPVSPPIVLARVRTHLQLKANADFLRDKSEYLELEVRRRTRQLQQLQDAVIAARPAFRVPPLRPADRLQPSRTLGWPGLSGRPGGRADSPGGADRRPGRPLR